MALEAVLSTSWPSAVVYAFATVGIASTFVIVSIALTVLTLRPWDRNFRRNHDYVYTTPFMVFLWNSWVMRIAELVVDLKPGPMRLADIATTYTQSQVGKLHPPAHIELW